MIERILGSGGMASVWLARDLVLERPCAVKMLAPDNVDVEDCRQRFDREARVSARVRGANVVNVFDCGESDGVPYIVMEYLRGEDLRSRIASSGPLGPEATCEIVAQVARGLANAHSAGIVHRDIKPDNVFLAQEADGECVKVLDFGIATEVARAGTEAPAQPEVFVGTALYASPEQFRGERVDWRADLWSLAVLAFECLTGERPFRCTSFTALYEAVLDGPVPEFRAFERGLPAELEDWWQRALARNPEERFQSAKQLVDALADALGLSRLSVSSIRPAFGPVETSTPRRNRTKATAFWASSVLLALTLGAGVGLAAEPHPAPGVASAGMAHQERPTGEAR